MADSSLSGGQMPARVPDRQSNEFSAGRITVLLLVTAAFGCLWLTSGVQLSLKSLAEQEDVLRRLQQTRPALTYGVAFVIYVVATGLSLPGATILSVACGRTSARIILRPGSFIWELMSL